MKIRKGTAFLLLAALWGMVGLIQLSPASLAAHPRLEREPVANRMKGPGPLSSRRLPLSVAPVKRYLPIRAAEQGGPGVAVFGGILSFYRNVISPLDGNRCSMAPTCSLYSHQALQRHGLLMGVLLTADRLLHEGDEIGRVPKTEERGEVLYLDPLEANTYWWPDWLK